VCLTTRQTTSGAPIDNLTAASCASVPHSYSENIMKRLLPFLGRVFLLRRNRVRSLLPPSAPRVLKSIWNSVLTRPFLTAFLRTKWLSSWYQQHCWYSGYHIYHVSKRRIYFFVIYQILVTDKFYYNCLVEPFFTIQLCYGMCAKVHRKRKSCVYVARLLRQITGWTVVQALC